MCANGCKRTYNTQLLYGAVAQLARAIALQAIGYGFDPRQLHHFNEWTGLGILGS